MMTLPGLALFYGGLVRTKNVLSILMQCLISAGLMGVIWDRKYFHAKVDLHQAIADLSSIIKPHLTLIDASRALLTGGPSGPGKVAKLNTCIAGVDPVAVDTYGVSIADWYNKKFEIGQVKHIMAAHRMGLGTIDLDQLRITKEHV